MNFTKTFNDVNSGILELLAIVPEIRDIVGDVKTKEELIKSSLELITNKQSEISELINVFPQYGIILTNRDFSLSTTIGILFSIRSKYNKYNNLSNYVFRVSFLDEFNDENNSISDLNLNNWIQFIKPRKRYNRHDPIKSVKTTSLFNDVSETPITYEDIQK